MKFHKPVMFYRIADNITLNLKQGKELVTLSIFYAYAFATFAFICFKNL